MGRAAALLAALAVALSLASGPTASAREHQRAKLCVPAEVERTVKRFLAAFNAGNLRALDGVFARKPYFRWYSTDAPGERFLPIAADRRNLVAYFAQRHGHGERLTLRSLRVNGNTVARGRSWKTYGNFEHRLVREADDLAPTEYQGKGSLHCYASRPDELIVWSMARAS